MDFEVASNLDIPQYIDLESFMKTPELVNVEVYNLRKSKYPMFAKFSKLNDEQRSYTALAPGASPDSYVVICPYCAIPMKIKGNALMCPKACPITFNMSIRHYMNQPVKGEYFFKARDLEEQYFYFPLCDRCKKVSFGASTNKNYSTHLQAYWMCGCERALPTRITLSAPFDKTKLQPGSSLFKLCEAMFSEHYFRIKPIEPKAKLQVVGGGVIATTSSSSSSNIEHGEAF